MLVRLKAKIGLLTEASEREEVGATVRDARLREAPDTSQKALFET